MKKFELMGYQVHLDNSVPERDYTATTIEYKPDKKDQADMVKTDLGLAGDINMQEAADAKSDVVIYSFAPQNPLLGQIKLQQ